MKKELSSEARDLLSSLNSYSLVDPDEWHFHIRGEGKLLPGTPQLTRDLVRKMLVEINEYKPTFLSPEVKKDFNLVRIADKDDLIPSETDLTRLKSKLHKLTEDSQIKFDIEYSKKDPNHKIENTLVSAWMIDIQDVIDFIKGEELEIIYRRVVERRRDFDQRLLSLNSN